MRVERPDQINDRDSFLREWYPSATWVIGWFDRGNLIECEHQAREIATQCCTSDFFMPPGYTFIAFETEEDAMLTYLGLA